MKQMLGDASYIGTRARFQRLGDAKLFNGWVHDIKNESLLIRCEEECTLAPGDRLLFEVAGLNESLIFEARFRDNASGLHAFDISTVRRHFKAQETIRLAVSNMEITIFADSEQVQAIVKDISPNGLGVVLDKAIQKGEIVQIALSTSHGSIESKAEVRYCRSVGGQFRIGLQFTDMARIDKGRWIRLFEGAA